MTYTRVGLAAANGNLGHLDSALAAGDDVNAVDPNGCSALMHAARRGHAAIAARLIAAGADALKVL